MHLRSPWNFRHKKILKKNWTPSFIRAPLNIKVLSSENSKTSSKMTVFSQKIFFDELFSRIWFFSWNVVSGKVKKYPFVLRKWSFFANEWLWDDFGITCGGILNDFLLTSSWLSDDFWMILGRPLHDFLSTFLWLLDEFGMTFEWLLNVLWMNFKWIL